MKIIGELLGGDRKLAYNAFGMLLGCSSCLRRATAVELQEDA